MYILVLESTTEFTTGPSIPSISPTDREGARHGVEVPTTETLADILIDGEEEFVPSAPALHRSSTAALSHLQPILFLSPASGSTIAVDEIVVRIRILSR